MGNTIEIYKPKYLDDNYNVSPADHTLICTASSGSIKFNLPSAVGLDKKVYYFENQGAATLSVDADGSETIDGSAAIILNNGDTLEIISDGSNWVSTYTLSQVEGTNVLSTGETGGTKFLREDGDGTCSWQTPSGGGGAPTENVILTGTKTSGQNINGVEGTETDLTWDVVSQDTGELTSFSTGDSKVIFTNAGWLNVHASAYVSNGVVNNRSMWSVSLYHYDSADSLKYSYHGDMQYNRDDNVAYDASGGSVSQNMMNVSAGDYIYIRMRVFDDGTAATSQTLDTTYSKIRIAQINF